MNSQQDSREAAARNTHQRAFEWLLKYAPTGEVADIPCGSGAFTRRLVDHGYGVHAVDIEGHSGVPEVDFHQADMNEPLPFSDGALDAIVSIEGIEHLRRPFDFIAECRRCLKLGGHLIITTPNISSLRSRVRWLLTGFHHKAKYPLDETHPAPRHHITMLSLPALRYILHTQGFQICTLDTNRIKAVSWLLLPLAPFVWAASALAYRRGTKGDAHRRIVREVLSNMTSKPILLGEITIIVARAV